MTTEERLEKLEKELARAKRLNRLSLAVVLLAFVLLVAAMTTFIASRDNIIKAKKFVVIDKNGMKRVELDAELSPHLSIYDEIGRLRVALSGPEDGGVLNLFDENGRHCAGLYAGRKLGPQLALMNENGAPIVWLKASQTETGLTLYDKNRMARAALGTTQTTTPDGKVITYPESSLLLFDPNGHVIWEAPR